MSYLVTGANGMLGHDLVAALAGRDVTALGRAELDVTDLDAVRAGAEWTGCSAKTLPADW